jgi:hypothetical protein
MKMRTVWLTSPPGPGHTKTSIRPRARTGPISVMAKSIAGSYAASARADLSVPAGGDIASWQSAYDAPLFKYMQGRPSATGKHAGSGRRESYTSPATCASIPGGVCGAATMHVNPGHLAAKTLLCRRSRGIAEQRNADNYKTPPHALG